MKLEYFGTDLSQAGHYFFILSGNSFQYSEREFGSTPFNPERINENYDPKGSVIYLESGIYSVCAICGSPTDKRPGCKSVFFTDKKVSHTQWKDLIYSIPIAKRIIEQMPFEVKW